MNRLDKEIYNRKLVTSRSQAENYIKLGVVTVNGKTVTKPGFLVSEDDNIKLASEQYVSRAALKLASIAKQFRLDFKDKVVLDVGSSTGGFTDYALQHGAKKVIAVDVGKDQLHPTLHGDKRIELHEKTDIRDFKTSEQIDIMVADVSFISLTNILPSLQALSNKNTELIMMCKPQFEAGKDQVNKGVIKNSATRRKVLKGFENWLNQNGFVTKDKADSQVAGAKGNVERFYKLSTSSHEGRVSPFIVRRIK